MYIFWGKFSDIFTLGIVGGEGGSKQCDRVESSEGEVVSTSILKKLFICYTRSLIAGHPVYISLYVYWSLIRLWKSLIRFCRLLLRFFIDCTFFIDLCLLDALSQSWYVSESPWCYFSDYWYVVSSLDRGVRPWYITIDHWHRGETLNTFLLTFDKFISVVERFM